MERNKVSRIESVHRAMLILKLMNEQGSVSVSEAAEHLTVNPSTASRLLDTLAGDGFAIQGEKRRYRPGPELLRAGQKQNPIQLRNRLRPYLEQLYTLAHETVHLASLIGTEVHHHDFIEARHHTLVFTNRMNRQLPAHVTSEGKSMLAELSNTEIQLRYRGLPSNEQPADFCDFFKEIDTIRKEGVATNFEESEKGIAAMSTSIGILEGKLLSLSIALPIARYSEEIGAHMRSSLLTVKKEIQDANGIRVRP